MAPEWAVDSAVIVVDSVDEEQELLVDVEEWVQVEEVLAVEDSVVHVAAVAVVDSRVVQAKSVPPVVANSALWVVASKVQARKDHDSKTDKHRMDSVHKAAVMVIWPIPAADTATANRVIRHNSTVKINSTARVAANLAVTDLQVTGRRKRIRVMMLVIIRRRMHRILVHTEIQITQLGMGHKLGLMLMASQGTAVGSKDIIVSKATMIVVEDMHLLEVMDLQTRLGGSK